MPVLCHIVHHVLNSSCRRKCFLDDLGIRAVISEFTSALRDRLYVVLQSWPVWFPRWNVSMHLLTSRQIHLNLPGSGSGSLVAFRASSWHILSYAKNTFFHWSGFTFLMAKYRKPIKIRNACESDADLRRNKIVYIAQIAVKLQQTCKLARTCLCAHRFAPQTGDLWSGRTLMTSALDSWNK